MMRKAISGLLLAAALFPAPADAAEECRKAVEDAFTKQRTAKGFRFTAEMPSAEGPTRMTIDYMPPDRMYQKVEAPGHVKPVETIAIARWAWGTMGGGWEELQPQFAQSITSHVHETLVAPLQISADFTCLGKVQFEGAEYFGYRADQPSTLANADAKAPALARTLYVDAASGQPMRNVVARLDGSEPPVFVGRYSYPTDIAIEAPVGGHDIAPSNATKQ